MIGLIRCSHCGFAFQGWSGSVNGQRYYKYIDGRWQDKRVCSFFGISKLQIEEFVMQCIKDMLYASDVLMKVEQKLQLLFDCKPSELLRMEKEIQGLLFIVDYKINRWLKAFEAGSESKSVLQRIKTLEIEKHKLVDQLNNAR